MEQNQLLASRRKEVPLLLQVLFTINPPAKQTRPSDTRDNLRRGSREPIWVGIVELKPGMCRYLRDGASGVEYCGAPTTPWASSWCQAHRKVVYPPQERGRATERAP